MSTLSPGIVAYGVALKIGDGASPETFTEIPGLSDVDFSPTWSETDITAHRSGASLPTVERKKTLLDNGSVSGTLRLDMSLPVHVALYNSYRSTTGNNFQLVSKDPSMSTRQFFGLVMGFEESHPTDGVIEVQLNIAVSGDIHTV